MNAASRRLLVTSVEPSASGLRVVLDGVVDQVALVRVVAREQRRFWIAAHAPPTASKPFERTRKALETTFPRLFSLGLLRMAIQVFGFARVSNGTVEVQLPDHPGSRDCSVELHPDRAHATVAVKSLGYDERTHRFAFEVSEDEIEGLARVRCPKTVIRPGFPEDDLRYGAYVMRHGSRVGVFSQNDAAYTPLPKYLEAVDTRNNTIRPVEQSTEDGWFAFWGIPKTVYLPFVIDWQVVEFPFALRLRADQRLPERKELE